ncbi:ferredoxin [Actinomadura alba]|uniref:Ferredoxin n=1 Tax=Actinomadura alba TaxID=406431 RepID=A0ABR7LS23_9ACTN|nr:ferredoxin [Actinomadura alba]MBC6467531.1 ferredoxin [Actinomadura alba]
MSTTRWKLTVDQRMCCSSGICVSIAHDRFCLDTGVSQPIAEEIDPDDAVLEAAESCPTEAISVRDAADGTLIAP